MALKEFFIRGINVRKGISVTMATEVNRTTFDQMRRKFFKEARRLATLDNLHIVEVSDFNHKTAHSIVCMQVLGTCYFG